MEREGDARAEALPQPPRSLQREGKGLVSARSPCPCVPEGWQRWHGRLLAGMARGIVLCCRPLSRQRLAQIVTGRATALDPIPS